MGTRHRGTAAEVRALNAYINLMRAAESVTARLQPWLDEHGLTVTQFGALEALLHLGPMCQRELGEKLLKSGGNITMVVSNLEKAGLVRRARAGRDQRFITVSLTARGRGLIRKIFPPHVAAIVRNLGALSVAEQEELRRLCRKLGRQTNQ